MRKMTLPLSFWSFRSCPFPRPSWQSTTAQARRPQGSETIKNHLYYDQYICGLYYKHVTIVNYASSSINKLRASLNDDARVIIYDCHMFIVQATDLLVRVQIGCF
jgi:hypothetical protein